MLYGDSGEKNTRALYRQLQKTSNPDVLTIYIMHTSAQAIQGDNYCAVSNHTLITAGAEDGR